MQTLYLSYNLSNIQKNHCLKTLMPMMIIFKLEKYQIYCIPIYESSNPRYGKQTRFVNGMATIGIAWCISV